jgi:hypothetical protein
MAFNDLSTAWTGKEADGFYSLYVLTGDSKATFRQMANIKDKQKVASLEITSFLQADACAVPESGNHTIDDITVTVCDLAFNIPICAKDYENMYLSETMKPGSNVEENFPAGLVDYIKFKIGENLNAEIEKLSWKGSTTASPPDLCDGILKKLLADNDVVDIASPLTLSTSNIVAELTRVVAALPTTIKNRGKNDVKIYVSIAAASIFELAMYATSPAIYAYNRDEMTLRFAGYELIVTPGLYDNTIVMTDPMNLIYATDLASDEKEIFFKQNPTPGSENKYNFIGKFKAGFQIMKGSEIVLYGGTA